MILILYDLRKLMTSFDLLPTERWLSSWTVAFSRSMRIPRRCRIPTPLPRWHQWNNGWATWRLTRCNDRNETNQLISRWEMHQSWQKSINLIQHLQLGTRNLQLFFRNFDHFQGSRPSPFSGPRLCPSAFELRRSAPTAGHGRFRCRRRTTPASGFGCSLEAKRQRNGGCFGDFFWNIAKQTRKKSEHSVVFKIAKQEKWKSQRLFKESKEEIPEPQSKSVHGEPCSRLKSRGQTWMPLHCRRLEKQWKQFQNFDDV